MLNTIIIILIIIGITFVYGSYKVAPWVPTWGSDLNRFLKLAEIKPSQVMYDLGCGDGRLICAASEKGACATGFEVSILPYLMALFRIHTTQNKAKIKFKNFWDVNISDADIIYFFLMPKIYPAIKEKLDRELKPGAKVIAYTWPIKGWKARKIDKIKGKPNLYLYIKK